MAEVNVEFTKLNPEAIVPTKAHPGDACYDLYSVEAFKLNPNERHVFNTGLAVALPDHYELQIRPRSGLALSCGVTVLNSPGTVDSNYRGEIGVILINHSTNAHTVKVGDRIAQASVKRYETVMFNEVDSLEKTDRGSKGYGSSGS